MFTPPSRKRAPPSQQLVTYSGGPAADGSPPGIGGLLAADADRLSCLEDELRERISRQVAAEFAREFRHLFPAAGGSFPAGGDSFRASGGLFSPTGGSPVAGSYNVASHAPQTIPTGAGRRGGGEEKISRGAGRRGGGEEGSLVGAGIQTAEQAVRAAMRNRPPSGIASASPHSQQPGVRQQGGGHRNTEGGSYGSGHRNTEGGSNGHRNTEGGSYLEGAEGHLSARHARAHWEAQVEAQGGGYPQPTQGAESRMVVHAGRLPHTGQQPSGLLPQGPGHYGAQQQHYGYGQPQRGSKEAPSQISMAGQGPGHYGAQQQHYGYWQRGSRQAPSQISMAPPHSVTGAAPASERDRVAAEARARNAERQREGERAQQRAIDEAISLRNNGGALYIHICKYGYRYINIQRSGREKESGRSSGPSTRPSPCATVRSTKGLYIHTYIYIYIYIDIDLIYI